MNDPDVDQAVENGIVQDCVYKPYSFTKLKILIDRVFKN